MKTTDYIKELSHKYPTATDVFSDLDKMYKTSINEHQRAVLDLFFTTVGELMKKEEMEYVHLDKIMDDSASRITVMTGIDVRADGIEKALYKVFGKEKGCIIYNTIKWYVACVFKHHLKHKGEYYE